MSSIVNSSNSTPSKAPEPSKGTSVIVKAYYIGREIDIMKINSSMYFANANQEFQKKSVILTLNESLYQYVSVFKFGSVVFFNVPNESHSECLNQIKEATSFPIAEELQLTEEYKVIVHENLDKPSVIKAEHVNIKNLDKKNITIGNILLFLKLAAFEYYRYN